MNLHIMPGTIPFDVCPHGVSWPHGHCWHGKQHLGNLGVCCNCGKEEAHPWTYQAETRHGKFHPHEKKQP